ncbi:MFS transporter [Aminobacter sp. MDW-2]|uniref:MFS transporter n=1 Tax=Aminobacter sp. MDW-2 TaxID=2666139 RepID=UPI0012B13490|nr:MFS transporter [Aminobacter sp. MDW-2]MRX35070.1 MFS transporter [Aminobacter sp. MDW-2]QNH32857.1 MFS transporter [Aminobacter sp. MDW-2]
MTLPPLTPEQQVKPRRFELRISLLFAALFVPMGVHLPYFPLWLEAKGFDPEQIAIVLSAPMFLRVITTPLIAAMADRAKDRANVFIFLAASSLLLSLGYFLEPTYLIVLAVSLALAVVWTPHSPIADSLALSGVRRFGSDYAAMRIWGSIAFLAGSLGAGFILSLTGAAAVPAIISIGLLGCFLMSFIAPRLGRPRKASPLSATDMQAAPKLFNRYFLLMAGGTGVIIGSHGFLYGFVSIYWKSLGINETIVGLLWSWGVAAEIVMFMFFTRLFGNRSTALVLVLAGAGAIVRWVAYPLIWPLGLGVPGFFAVQSLHAVSTALVLIGVQKLIAESVPEERTGAAQGVAYFANGMSMAIVTLLSGPLYQRFGVDGFYFMAAVAACAIVLVVLASRSAPKFGQGRRHH